MRAFTFDRYGGPEVLELREVPDPVPDDGSVLVSVKAVSINDWDLGRVGGELTNRVMNGLRSPRNRIPGCDVAGVVEAVGPGVKTLAPGDAVYGDLSMAGFRTFAERVCGPETSFAPKPPDMTFIQAAAVPQAAMLAVQGLMDVRTLTEGVNSLLLNGAGGGVGTFGVQIARRTGVHITCVDSAEKLPTLTRLGADRVIDYRTRDFTREGRRYDLILDTRTTRSPFEYLRALEPDGIYATVGGDLPRLAQAYLFGKLIARREREVRIVALQPNRDLDFINREFEAGRITPIIDSVFPFEALPAAMERFATARHVGKVIVSLE